MATQQQIEEMEREDFRRKIGIACWSFVIGFLFGSLVITLLVLHHTASIDALITSCESVVRGLNGNLSTN